MSCHLGIEFTLDDVFDAFLLFIFFCFLMFLLFSILVLLDDFSGTLFPIGEVVLVMVEQNVPVASLELLYLLLGDDHEHRCHKVGSMCVYEACFRHLLLVHQIAQVFLKQ